MPFLKTAGAEIHYEEYGSGYPVLLYSPGFLSSRIERWWTNPAKPGVEQAWADPIPVLSSHFKLIGLDVRNAGESRAPVTPADGWHSYSEDSLELLDHLGITQCHVMGACIGVSFALGLAAARDGLVTSLVLQNPIGLVETNRDMIDGEFDAWAEKVGQWPDVDAALLPDLGRRLFGGDFIFSVSREFVSSCQIPTLIMPGNDQMHPAEIGAELARLSPNSETIEPWKGPDHRDESMLAVRDYLVSHTP